MPSPLVEIKDGSAAYVTAVGGVNITPSNTIVIRLASQTDVDSWLITCITTDGVDAAGTVTASLTIDSAAKTATFTAPAAGKVYRFQSKVNGGIDRNGVAQSSYSTTFCLYTVKNGRRKVAADESTEGDSTSGWVTALNALVDALPSGVAQPSGLAGGGGGNLGIFGQNFNFLTYQGGSAVGATGLDYVPTLGTINANRGINVTGTGVATLANSMLNAGTAATGFRMVAPFMQGLMATGVATLASAMLSAGTAATGFQLVSPVMVNPIMGGTAVFTGLDMVADGLVDHKPVSVIRRLQTTDATVTPVFSFLPKDEAITQVFVEVNAVASGGAGAGSYVRAAAIKMDGGVGTCSATEVTRSQEFTHSGVGFTGVAVGSGIIIGVSGATGFVNVKGGATGSFKWGATVTYQTTSWA